MSSEQTSSVVFRVPDFVDSDGIEYTDIEMIVRMDGSIRHRQPCWALQGGVGQNHQAGTYKK